MTPPLGPLRRTARPDVALKARGWRQEWPAWWSHPTLGTRLTMAEAWARTVAAERREAVARAGDGGQP